MLAQQEGKEAKIKQIKVPERVWPQFPFPAEFATRNAPLGTHRSTRLPSGNRTSSPTPYFFKDLKWVLKCLVSFSCLLSLRHIYVGIGRKDSPWGSSMKGPWSFWTDSALGMPGPTGLCKMAPACFLKHQVLFSVWKNSFSLEKE